MKFAVSHKSYTVVSYVFFVSSQELNTPALEASACLFAPSPLNNRYEALSTGNNVIRMQHAQHGTPQTRLMNDVCAPSPRRLGVVASTVPGLMSHFNPSRVEKSAILACLLDSNDDSKI